MHWGIWFLNLLSYLCDGIDIVYRHYGLGLVILDANTDRTDAEEVVQVVFGMRHTEGVFRSLFILYFCIFGRESSIFEVLNVD